VGNILCSAVFCFVGYIGYTVNTEANASIAFFARMPMSRRQDV
jgi:hypothetical protein